MQAVSKSIATLNVSLILPLFFRANRGVTPTEIGHYFYAKTKPAVVALQEVERFSPNKASQEGRQQEKPLKIGLVSPHSEATSTPVRKLQSFLGKACQ